MPKPASRPKPPEPAVAEAEPHDAAPAKRATERAPKGTKGVKKAAGAKAPGKAQDKRAAAAPSAKGTAKTTTKTKSTTKSAAAAKKARLPSPKTFLVAATRLAEDGTTVLQVYAAVTRSPAEALAAVRAELGPEVAVELTGKLSNRMAKGLGLKPGALRPI